MPFPRDETTPPVTKTYLATYARLPVIKLTELHPSSVLRESHSDDGRDGVGQSVGRGLHEVVEPPHRDLGLPAADRRR